MTKVVSTISALIKAMFSLITTYCVILNSVYLLLSYSKILTLFPYFCLVWNLVTEWLVKRIFFLLPFSCLLECIRPFCRGQFQEFCETEKDFIFLLKGNIHKWGWFAKNVKIFVMSFMNDHLQSLTRLSNLVILTFSQTFPSGVDQLLGVNQL